MPHEWDREKPHPICVKCGASQVMMRAMVEGWLTPATQEDPERWKTGEHRELALLCDDHCYAEMSKVATEAHKGKIIALCQKIGWKKAVNV